MIYDDAIHFNYSDTADAFANFFKSVFSKPNQNNINTNNVIYLVINLSHSQISLDRVYKGLLNFENNRGAGPDEILNTFLVKCAIFVALPPILIFNKSLSTRIFPSIWKKK